MLSELTLPVGLLTSSRVTPQIGEGTLLPAMVPPNAAGEPMPISKGASRIMHKFRLLGSSIGDIPLLLITLSDEAF
jgi:hypothetical protein